jgi:hypothetical protein
MCVSKSLSTRSGSPTGRSAQRTDALSFTPRRVAIERTDGDLLESLDDPRASFAHHGRDTPWSTLQLAYFVGTAMWTYLTQPFAMSLPGFATEELERWNDGAANLRRLRVVWPDYLATHSTEQTLYFDEDGLLARHDYEVEIVGGAPSVHLFSDFQTVEGIVFPTKHRIYPRDETGNAQEHICAPAPRMSSASRPRRCSPSRKGSRRSVRLTRSPVTSSRLLITVVPNRLATPHWFSMCAHRRSVTTTSQYATATER